jgi:hypothetical protein
VAQFRYLGTTITNEILIQEEIKRRLNSVCPLVCCLKTLKLKNAKLYYCLLFCMYVKLGLLTLREERRLKVFEIRVLRGIFGLKRDELMGDLRKLHNEELHNKTCIVPQV